MKRYNIKLYKIGQVASLYTIHFKGKTSNETDEFISRFLGNSKYKKDFDTIIQFLAKIGENGALERYFRPERKASALPISSSKLRLYCFRLSDRILIIGNGGIKTTKKVQDSLDCFPHFNLLNDLAYKLEYRLKESGSVKINIKELKGNLKFTSK